MSPFFLNTIRWKSNRIDFQLTVSYYLYINKSISMVIIDDLMIISNHFDTKLTGNFKIILFNKINKESYQFDDLQDQSGNKLIYVFGIDTTDLVEGEYTYSLYVDNQLIETGLAVKGDYSRVTAQHQTINKYKQYE